MAKKRNVTSIVCAKHLEPVKNQLADIYGLTRVVSTGIWLFAKLSPAQQQNAIREAMASQSDKDYAIQFLLDLPKDVRQEICKSLLDEIVSQESAEAPECKNQKHKKLKPAQ